MDSIASPERQLLDEFILYYYSHQNFPANGTQSTDVTVTDANHSGAQAYLNCSYSATGDREEPFISSLSPEQFPFGAENFNVSLCDALNGTRSMELNVADQEKAHTYPEIAAHDLEEQPTLEIKAYSPYHNFQIEQRIFKGKDNNKQKRVSKACWRCHDKKRKCDGQQPECIRCQNAGERCVYGGKADGIVTSRRSIKAIKSKTRKLHYGAPC